ncbi:MAG: hypothetical protein NZO16_07105 [Deltaproteobacteria bacterium]|nr:hypothetical protein [Deltaproteobacteria bacterium]
MTNEKNLTIAKTGTFTIRQGNLESQKNIDNKKAEQASKQLSAEFMKLLVKELIHQIDLPGSSIEKDFVRDNLIEILSKHLTQSNENFVKTLLKEVTAKK